jgi:tetratricopeptide (TPR) repeat protein
VVIVGEPGIGKSRLVAELYAHVDAHPEMTTWRQGCCLSCGDAVTFWALAGIVKAHAGILETDDRDTVETKLDAVLPEGEDREWLRQRLRALLGLEAPQASREENFNAWLRFLEEIAVSGATVLVLEDLHWAEDALLAFLEYAASNVAHVSLLLVATTRPELFESHPSFAASGRINRVVLEPLSEVETETLVASLLGELPMDVRETIARRAQGNPFYAEESARLVKDRVRGGGEAETTVAVAASVRAVIAARLDALPPEMKAALADAAVVGQTFWDGALAALDDRPLDEVEACLQGLMERQLVHRVRSSSMAGEHEFAFEHALARDVVYGALPRRVRAEKHTHVAAWLEAKAGEHLEDISDQLTHHRVTAFELAQASGQDELVERLRASTVTVLGLAGRRTMRVDIEAAERLFAKAVELCADDDDRRAALLDAWARSLLQRGRFEESRAAFEEAFRLFLAQGRSGEAAVAMTRLINGSFDLGAPPAAAYDDALALIADEPDGEASATVMTEKAGAMIAASDYVGGLEWVQRASEVYRRRGMDVPLTLQSWRAQAECGLGELAAADRLLAVIRAMRDEGLGRETAVAYVNAQVFRYPLLGTAAYDISDEGLEFARSRGITEVQGLLEVNRCYGLFVAGSWADALSRLEASSSWLAEGPQFAALFFWDFRARILVSLGRGDEAICDVQRADELAQQHSGDPGVHRWVRCGMAEVLTAIGQQSRATEVLNELADWPRPQGYFGDEENIPGLMRCALRLGEADLAEQLARGLQPGLPLVDHVIVTAQALLAWANGEHEAAAAGFADAVIRWQDFGMPYEKAQALLGQGRCLLGLGKVPEAAAVLERAREIFSRLGAKPALAETNELMLQLSSA